MANEQAGRGGVGQPKAGATCRLFHDWQKWSKPKGGKFQSNPDRDILYQERVCQRCGAIGLRHLVA